MCYIVFDIVTTCAILYCIFLCFEKCRNPPPRPHHACLPMFDCIIYVLYCIRYSKYVNFLTSTSSASSVGNWITGGVQSMMFPYCRLIPGLISVRNGLRNLDLVFLY